MGAFDDIPVTRKQSKDDPFADIPVTRKPPKYEDLSFTDKARGMISPDAPGFIESTVRGAGSMVGSVLGGAAAAGALPFVGVDRAVEILGKGGEIGGNLGFFPRRASTMSKPYEEAFGHAIEKGTDVLATGAERMAESSPGVKLGITDADKARNVARTVTKGFVDAAMLAPVPGMIKGAITAPGRIRKGLQERQAKRDAETEAAFTPEQRKVIDEYLQQEFDFGQDVPYAGNRAGGKLRQEDLVTGPDGIPYNRSLSEEIARDTNQPDLFRSPEPYQGTTMQSRPRANQPGPVSFEKQPPPRISPDFTERGFIPDEGVPYKEPVLGERVEGRVRDFEYDQALAQRGEPTPPISREQGFAMQEQQRALQARDDTVRRQLMEEEASGVPPREPSQGGPRVELPQSRVRLPGRQGGQINPEVFKEGFRKVKGMAGKTYNLVAEHVVNQHYPAPGILRVKAIDKRLPPHHPQYEKGWALFHPTREGLKEFSQKDLYSIGTGVPEEFRRQGIATDLYEFASELGNDIVPSKFQSDKGKAMWQGFERNWNVEGGKFKPMMGGRQQGFVDFGVGEKLGDLFNKATAGRRERRATRDLNELKDINKSDADVVDLATSTRATPDEWVAAGNEFTPFPDMKSIPSRVTGGARKLAEWGDQVTNLYRYTKNEGIPHVLSQVKHISENEWLKTATSLKGVRFRYRGGTKVREITDPNSIAVTFDKLTSKEKSDTAAIVNEFGGKRVPTKEELTASGYSTKVVNAVMNMERVYKDMWDRFNKAREALDKKPVEYLPFYFAKYFGEGNFVARVIGKDGKTVFFTRRRSIKEAEQLANDFKKELGDEYKVESKYERQDKQLDKYNLGPGVFEDLVAALEKGDPRIKVVRDIYDQIQGKRVAHGHAIKRRNIAGGEVDGKSLWKVFENYTDQITKSIVNMEITNLEKQLTRNESFRKAGSDFQDWAKTYLSSVRGGNLNKSIQKVEGALDDILGAARAPGIGKVTSTANKIFLQAKLMALNAGFWAASWTQSVAMGPWGISNAAQRGGYKGSSWAAVGKGMMDMIAPSKDQMRFIEYLASKNRVDPSFTHDLGHFGNKIADNFVDYGLGSAIPKRGESFGRIHSALSSYNLLWENGLRGKKLYEEAGRMMENVMGDYSVYNRPHALRDTGFVGSAASPITTFNLFYGGMLLETLKEFSKGPVSPQRIAPLANALIGFTAFAGLIGAPMINALSGIYDFLKSIPALKPYFSKKSLEEVMMTNLPDPAVFGLLDSLTTNIDPKGMRIAGSMTAPEIHAPEGNLRSMVPGLALLYDIGNLIYTETRARIWEDVPQRERDKAINNLLPSMARKLNQLLDSHSEELQFSDNPIATGNRGFGGANPRTPWERAANVIGSGTLPQERAKATQMAFEERMVNLSSKQIRTIDLIADELSKPKQSFKRLDDLMKKAEEQEIDNLNERIKSTLKQRILSAHERKVGTGTSRRQQELLLELDEAQEAAR